MTDRSTHDQTPFDEESDAMLMALADGELSPNDAAPLLARVAADPAMADRFAVFVTTRVMVRDAFDAGPVPDRLVRAILTAPTEAAPAPNVVAMAPRRSRLMAPLALAASLVLAVGVGSFMGARSPATVQVADDIAEVAAVELAALPTGGEAGFDGGQGRVLGSYDTARGLCRLIAVTATAGREERAVVCREAGGWTVALAITAMDGAYVPASDEAVALIDGFLDQIGAGPALSPDEEAAALLQ
jgi:hypothetical protein